MLPWWRGDMYENRFLCGVDGVRDVGSEVVDGLLGGV